MRVRAVPKWLQNGGLALYPPVQPGTNVSVPTVLSSRGHRLRNVEVETVPLAGAGHLLGIFRMLSIVHSVILDRLMFQYVTISALRIVC